MNGARTTNSSSRQQALSHLTGFTPVGCYTEHVTLHDLNMRGRKNISIVHHPDHAGLCRLGGTLKAHCHFAAIYSDQATCPSHSSN